MSISNNELLMVHCSLVNQEMVMNRELLITGWLTLAGVQYRFGDSDDAEKSVV